MSVPVTPASYQQTVKLRNRRIRRQIMLPMVVALLGVMVVFPVALLIVFSAQQFGVVAAMAVVLLAIPGVVVCIVPYALLLMGIVGMVGVNRRVPRYLHRARNTLHQVNQQTTRTAHQVTRPIMAVSQRLAWLERFMGGQPPRAR
jgi:hypothetical protein